jgi:hypothetical protein
MPKSATITSITRLPDRTRIRIGKSDIELYGVTTPADLRAWIREQFAESNEVLTAMALAAWAARDPGLANPNQLVGRTITLDLAGSVSAGILRIS